MYTYKYGINEFSKGVKSSIILKPYKRKVRNLPPQKPQSSLVVPHSLYVVTIQPMIDTYYLCQEECG